MALAVLAWANGAPADAAPGEWRSEAYYAVNGAVTAALIGGSALARISRRGLEAGGDTVWFPGDAGLRGRCSPEAAQLSDVALSLTVALPRPAMAAAEASAQRPRMLATIAGPCMMVAPTGTTNRPSVTRTTTRNPVTSGNSRGLDGASTRRIGCDPAAPLREDGNGTCDDVASTERSWMAGNFKAGGADSRTDLR